MNNALMFSKASDEWRTPLDLFQAVSAEFVFDHDAAGTAENYLVTRHSPGRADPYFGLDQADPRWRDAIAVEDWSACGRTFWLNPAYSRCRDFIAKAAHEARTHGCTVVCLVPSRTDTQWWHAYVWDRTHHRPWPGVEIRFLKGRLKFGMPGATTVNSAPFPSVLIIFRPLSA